MIAESQGRSLLALSEIAAKLHLAAQRNPRMDLFRLAPLSVADRLREGADVQGAGGRREQHAIVIAQDQVAAIHRPVSDTGRLQRIRPADIEALRTGRDRAQAEDRQPDRPDVSCVAMQAPDDDSRQPGSLSLKRHQIADAALIEPTAVVDHEHVTGRSRFERLKEDIDAADVPGRSRPAS